MEPERSSNAIQIWFVITLALLVGISIYLFVVTNNTTTPDTSVNVGTDQTTSDVPVAGQRRCIADTDCGAGKFCTLTQGVCDDKKAIGAKCNRNAQCLNATCVNEVCKGITCNADSECGATQFCGTNVCKEKRELNGTCSRNEQCASNFCSNSVCRQPFADSSTVAGSGVTGGTQTTGSTTGIVPKTGFFDDPSGIISVSVVSIFLGLLLFKSSQRLRDGELAMNTTSDVTLKVSSDVICDEYERKFDI